jgi:hypothetical protein
MRTGLAVLLLFVSLLGVASPSQVQDSPQIGPLSDPTRYLSEVIGNKLKQHVIAVEVIGDSGKASGEMQIKSVANGLYVSGAWVAVWESGSISINVTKINNDSSTATTGTLRLEFWATATAPSRGQGFTGYRLFTSSTINPLPPRTFYSDLLRTGAFSPPPNGTYWLVLVLTEFDSVNCPAADRFCIEDSDVSTYQETFGTVSGSYTDLWWSPSESGWGVTITHHSTGVAFVTWFTYDSQGLPWWYVASECRVVANRCNATLYETTGPPFGATFNPALVSARVAGSISFTFTGSNYALMSYSVRGVTGTKLITRQGF